MSQYERCPCCGETTLYRSYGMAMVGPDFFGYHCDPCELYVGGSVVGEFRRKVHDLVAGDWMNRKDDLVAAVELALEQDRERYARLYELNG